MLFVLFCFFFFKQKTAYEMRISDWSSDVCSSDLGKPPTLPYLRSVHSSNWSSQPKRRRACRLSKTVSEISILTNGSTWFRRSFRLPCGNLATYPYTTRRFLLAPFMVALICLPRLPYQPCVCRLGYKIGSAQGR